MADTSPSRKPQVNVQLEDSEMERLLSICAAENITRPALLVGIWVRENIKQHDGEAALMEVVLEARASGVDVVEVLAKAKAAALQKKKRK